VTIGQLEETPPNTYKGLRINLPDIAGRYANYYLVEWRARTKYDRMLETAYVTAYEDEDEWQVERIPYNIPGALVYYFNSRYAGNKRLRPNQWGSPSIGPKYRLLAVDMNYGPLRLGDTGGVLDSRKGSYDAAMTLQRAKRFTIQQVFLDGEVLTGPWTFPFRAAVKEFDDAKGYYAGLYAGSPCAPGQFCFANQDGSAVIPANGNYSTRITHYDGSPYPELYGVSYKGSVLGTGNPADDGVQHGVCISLISKSADNRKAKLHLNAPTTEFATTLQPRPQ
jgi:immune inhibitor A